MNTIQYSDLTLEQYIIGELDKGLVMRIREEMENDSELRKRITEIEQSNLILSEKYPGRLMASQIAERRGSKQRRGIFNMANVLVSGLAAALLVLVIWVPQRQSMEETPIKDDILRIKGGPEAGHHAPELFVFRKEQTKIVQLNDGAHAKAGDLLQLAYRAGNANFGIIVSVDGNGVLTQHFPEQHSDSCELKTGGIISLKHAYELDNAPVFERFWLITSNREFNPNKIFNSLKSQVTQQKKNDIIEFRFLKGFKMTSLSVSKRRKL